MGLGKMHLGSIRTLYQAGKFDEREQISSKISPSIRSQAHDGESFVTDFRYMMESPDTGTHNCTQG